VRTLNSAGIQPDIILARSVVPLDKKRKEKIALNCNMHQEDVISAPDIETIYEVPLNFEKDRLSDRIFKKLKLKPKKRDMRSWANFVAKIQTAKKTVRVGIVGKYFGTGNFILADSYISVIEAIKHAAFSLKRRPVIDWLDAEEYERRPAKLAQLKKYGGIIVPGGFGTRGVEGKIKVIEFCRKNKIPYLGLCYGMQLACVEFARHVCGLKRAHTTEIKKDTPYPVIDLMLEQKKALAEDRYGGTMRLGAYWCKLLPGTLARHYYRREIISERHRHRYEFNNKFRELMVKKGLMVSGLNPERDLVEIVELKNHPFFVGTQFHPEFKSRPLSPHPLFLEFIRAADK